MHNCFQEKSFNYLQMPEIMELYPYLDIRELVTQQWKLQQNLSRHISEIEDKVKLLSSSEVVDDFYELNPLCDYFEAQAKTDLERQVFYTNNKIAMRLKPDPGFPFDCVSHVRNQFYNTTEEAC